MNGKCSINNMNDNLHLIGIIFLSFILIVVIIYFYRNIIQKHCDIVEKYEVISSILTNNYGEGHSSGRNDIDKKTLKGKMTLRPCQVYFVGKEQQNACDDEYEQNPLSTCKYQFKDNWVEINNITNDDGSVNIYPKKIYNQSNTNDNITNSPETAQCFKKFEDQSDIRFIYNQNDLVKYDHGGEDEADTQSLNYFDNKNGNFITGNFISMKFNNNNDPYTNYTNIISSICSKKYITRARGLEQNMKFYKFILDKNNNIKGVKEAVLNSDMKSFNVSELDMEKFLNVDNINIIYNNVGNHFELIQRSQLSPINVEIYKFNYNYLCNEEESGIITEYQKSTFNNNKSYLHLKNNNEIKVILKYEGKKVEIPNMFKSHFENISNTNKEQLIDLINTLKKTILEDYNRDPQSMKNELEKNKEQYEIKINEANKLYESFGINNNISELLMSSFNVIDKTKTVNIQNIQYVNIKLINNFKKKLNFATILIDDNKTVNVNIAKFTNYNKNIEKFETIDTGLVTTHDWNWCGGEWGICNCNGQVKYGASGRWIYKNSSGNIGCNNWVFGEDPYYGRYKSCYCKIKYSQPKHTSGGVQSFTNYDANNVEKFTTSETDPVNYVKYVNDGYLNQQIYNLTITRNCICDILIVGGGGGGGGFGGGGGGGEVKYAENVTLQAGNYRIYVGNGGNGSVNYHGENGSNGHNSKIKYLNNDTTIIARGGGGGGSRHTYDNNKYYVGIKGNDGGSGGGGGHNNDSNSYASGGIKTASSGFFSGTHFSSFGNNGGNGRRGTSGGQPNHSSGGGGGAGAPGQDAVQNSDGTRTWDTNGGGGDGGIGIDMSRLFPTFGHDGWFGGGGGGNTYAYKGRQGYGSNYVSSSINNDIKTGKGGGGDGGFNTNRNIYGRNGMPETGGGGGGGVWGETNSAGKGGTGVVIINFKSYRIESQISRHPGAVSECIDTGTTTSEKVTCDSFTNYNKNCIEKFDDSITLNRLRYKELACGGYIFLEKNKNYTKFNVSFSSIQSINIIIKSASIYKIDANGVNKDPPLADLKKNIVDFIPENSGFYKFESHFFINSIDSVDINTNLQITCDNINLKDYIYNGDLWPEKWNSTTSSSIEKINLFNSIIKDIKLENNNSDSISNFKQFLNDDYDMFNKIFWNKLYNETLNNINKIAILLDDERCDVNNAYKSENTKFKNNCDKLKQLDTLNRIIDNSLLSTNIEELFKYEKFEKPEFKESNADVTFTSESHNIIDYITYEKKSNINDRTQKSINDNYYKYFEDETTERSIYTKAS